MSKIRILSEQVANQIAAGEVVERPASVVKEFLENAIDAGARQLTIEVEGGGTRLIRIVDDGEGMDEDDVLLCIERHATSKLSSQDQLGAIRTLGFRGEAVPSIASVSRLAITSRPGGAALGTRAEVSFGKVVKVHEMGCSRGTVMEVRDLFGNVPARRKFLKTPQTELAHIEDVVKGYALARPALGVTYSMNGREVLVLPAGVDSLEQRLKRLLAPKMEGPLIAVTADDHELQLTGFLLPPEEAPRSARLMLFVNGRAVRDRLLTHAVAEGLRNFVMKGQRPAGAICLELPPAEVDVNVHPAKHEVRFRQAGRLHQQVGAAVSGAMAGYQQALKKSLFVVPAASRDRQEVKTEPEHCQPSFQLREPEAPLVQDGKSSPPGDREREPAPTSQQPVSGALASGAAVLSPRPEILSGESRKEKPAVVPPPAAGAEPASGFRLVGQLLHAYLLAESSSGLVVIDQHAAHERLLFEQLQAQARSRQVASQTLLFPKMLTLGPEEIELLGKYGEAITQLGIELQDFGGGSYILKALPALLAHLPPEEVLGDILDRYRAGDQGERRGASGRLDSILATMACKAAIKAGQPLKEEEMAHLLLQIEDAGVFSHCPHGRPVMKFFTKNDMKRWFRRT
jgi:DNA mismatch repair protein MutL